jgi:hypothetical protein
MRLDRLDRRDHDDSLMIAAVEGWTAAAGGGQIAAEGSQGILRGC